MSATLRWEPQPGPSAVVPESAAPPPMAALSLVPPPAPGVGETTPWQKALLAAALLAVDPRGLGGVWLRARAGLVRDRWLEAVVAAFGPAVPSRRVAAGMADEQLTGGLDLGLTLQSGRPVARRGVLAEADGGLLVLAMAERTAPGAAAIIAAALDSGQVRAEREGISACHPARFALIALDEGIDEALPANLADRLGLAVGLDGIGWRATETRDRVVSPAEIAAAQARLPRVSVQAEMLEALCALALVYGGGSMRKALHLLRAAKAAAALRGADGVAPEDAEIALWLVLGLSMADLAPPAPPEAEAPAPDSAQPATDGALPPPAPPGGEAVGSADAGMSDPAPESDQPAPDCLQDVILAAVAAALPAGFLAALAARGQSGRHGAAGRSGAVRQGGARGRGIGITARPPSPSARLDVLATLRQAVPWQRLRSSGPRAQPGAVGPLLQIRKADFRYRRRCEKTGTTTIFVVDASGSAAVERLAETKGAIELVLAGCYVRRDSVAMIAFRGRAAGMLLEPTRSLVRAKRCLSALPGGGGTPLAAGILAALDLASGIRRKGQSVMTVFLTDGRGNVALDGTTDSGRVEADTARAALLFKAAGLPALVIDTARRTGTRAVALGRALGAETLALPRGGAQALALAVGRRLEG